MPPVGRAFAPPTVELTCTGATLGRPPPHPALVELEVDGVVVGRTLPQPAGNRQPRWDRQFELPSNRRRLVFRVLLVSGSSEMQAGLGQADLQDALGKPHGSSLSVSLLAEGGQQVGVLWFSVRPQQSQGWPEQSRSIARLASATPSVIRPLGAAPEQVSLPLASTQARASGTLVPAGFKAGSLSGGPVPLRLGSIMRSGRLAQLDDGRPMAPCPAIPAPSPALAPRSPAAPVPRAVAPTNGWQPSQASNRPAYVHSGPGGSATRLTITQKGQQGIAELMQSKDMMRHYSERPFSRVANGARWKALDPEAMLNFDDFRTALRQLLNELEIAPPPDQMMQKLFDKHRKEKEGLGPDDFEALLFRLLCFLRATDEVQTVPSEAKVGEERDREWRQEFLTRNTRRFADVYDIGQKLGEGSFGSVFLVEHKSQVDWRQGRSESERKKRVCKVIAKASAEKAGSTPEKVREEFSVLKMLDHPYVLRMFEDFEDDDNFMVVMEPCYGGDLQGYVKILEPMDALTYEGWVARVLVHVLSGIAYCHGRGVIHKDLKPENVMMLTEKEVPHRDVHVVVVDFGLAEVFASGSERSHVVCGTPPYMAPEVWKGNFSKGCDIWSVGVMHFYLLSGRLPFMAQRIEDFPQIVQMEPDWRLISGATPGAVDFCKQMLTLRESKRPKAQAALKSKWIASSQGAEADGGPKTAAGALGQTQIENLMHVGERTQFEQFVTRIVATQLDVGQHKSANEAFQALDTDGDGMLSYDELRLGLTSLGCAPEHLEETVIGLDVSKRGQVCYTEFLAGVINLRSKKPEERNKLMLLAWQQFTPDEQGRVLISSIEDQLATRGMRVADLPVELLQALSKEASGHVTFERFMSLIDGTQSSDEALNTLSNGGVRGSRGGQYLRWLMAH